MKHKEIVVAHASLLIKNDYVTMKKKFLHVEIKTLNTKKNCTEPSPSVSVPCLFIHFCPSSIFESPGNIRNT